MQNLNIDISKMRIDNNERGYQELIINDNCEFADFYSFAEQLKKLINIFYKEKLDDFDSIYWDFDFEGSEMVICYNIYLGISICPLKFKDASITDNEKLLHFFGILKTTFQL